jgi:hypothetical protein
MKVVSIQLKDRTVELTLTEALYELDRLFPPHPEPAFLPPPPPVVVVIQQQPVMPFMPVV